MHYESMLGYLETQYMRHSATTQDYHGLYSWIVDIVYHLLYFKHVNNVAYIRRNIGFYRGLSALVRDDEPLWVFTLNHDLIIECIAATMTDVRLNSGFTDEIVLLPRRDKTGRITGHLRAEVLSGSRLERSALPFSQSGTRGINLLKIHGALDIFTFRDGKDVLKISPDDNDVTGVLDVLRATNEELFVQPNCPVRATNEIAYADETGEVQFLRRSLLSGSYKFNPRNSQVLPSDFLKHFGRNLNYLHTLICIGYGFGDNHINNVMREWLELSDDRRLIVVAPDRDSVPEPLLHVAPQVEVRQCGATAFLDSYAGIVCSNREANEKRLAAWMHKHGDTARLDLDNCLRDFKRKQMRSLNERLNGLCGDDGGMDINAGRVLVERTVRELKERIRTLDDDLLDEFLAMQGI